MVEQMVLIKHQRIVASAVRTDSFFRPQVDKHTAMERRQIGGLLSMLALGTINTSDEATKSAVSGLAPD